MAFDGPIRAALGSIEEAARIAGETVSNRREERLDNAATRERFRVLRAGADRAATRNPELRADLDAIIAAYESEYPAFQRGVDTARAAIRNSGEAQGTAVALRQQYFDRVRTRILGDLTGEARQNRERAWAALSSEMQPESILAPIGRQFYDERNGGIQWGGIAGGIVGGLAGYFMAGKAGVSGWMWGVGMAVAVGLGTWIGNKVSEWVAPAAGAAGEGAARAIGIVRERTIGMENSPQPEAQLAANRQSPENDISFGETGTLSAPAVPNMRTQRPGTAPTRPGQA